MIGWIVLSVLATGLLGFALFRRKSGSPLPGDFPYNKNHLLCSPAERTFLRILDQAVGDEYRLLIKVRAADIAGINAGLDARARLRALSRIDSRHFDFILCSKADLSIVCAILLEQQTHRQRRRQMNREFLQRLCETIGLPLLQIPMQHNYSIGEIRAAILDALGAAPKDAAAQSAQIFPVRRGKLVAVPDTRKSAGTAPNYYQSADDLKPAEQMCPKCQQRMVRLKVRSGSKAGEEFWGCVMYPKCRCIIPITVRE